MVCFTHFTIVATRKTALLQSKTSDTSIFRLICHVVVMLQIRLGHRKSALLPSGTADQYFSMNTPVEKYTARIKPGHLGSIDISSHDRHLFNFLNTVNDVVFVEYFTRSCTNCYSGLRYSQDYASNSSSWRLTGTLYW